MPNVPYRFWADMLEPMINAAKRSLKDTKCSLSDAGSLLAGYAGTHD
jgi:hypothetical protein